MLLEFNFLSDHLKIFLSELDTEGVELGGSNGDVKPGGQGAVVGLFWPSVNGNDVLLPVEEGDMLVRGDESA